MSYAYTVNVLGVKGPIKVSMSGFETQQDAVNAVNDAVKVVRKHQIDCKAKEIKE